MPIARRSHAPTDIDYTHKKQTGGTGQFARVKLKLEPNETGKGNEFASSIVGGSIPKEYIPGVEKGVNSVWDNGMLIGFPMVDMKVTLYDGAFHEVDSSAIAFEIATRAAMKEGCEKAGVKLLEPIMDVEVVSPQDFVGGVIGDINSRRGQIRNQEMRGNASSFAPTCRSQTCSATSTSCARCRQVALSTRCSLRTMRTFRATWRTKSRPSTPDKKLGSAGEISRHRARRNEA